MELTQRIRELTALPGVSGQEDAVREYLLRALQGREDCECRVDALGNLIVKKNRTADPGKIPSHHRPHGRSGLSHHLY